MEAKRVIEILDNMRWNDGLYTCEDNYQALRQAQDTIRKYDKFLKVTEKGNIVIMCNCGASSEFVPKKLRKPLISIIDDDGIQTEIFGDVEVIPEEFDTTITCGKCSKKIWI